VVNRAAAMPLSPESNENEPSAATAPVPTVRVGFLLLLKTTLPRPVDATGAPAGTNLSQYNGALRAAQRGQVTKGTELARVSEITLTLENPAAHNTISNNMLQLVGSSAVSHL